ncbi:protein SERAC1 [Microdochium nivale]|nr:protein SERAC1 [Microdochium nivale]
MGFAEKTTGLIELYRPESGESDIDIVAVHGLNGDPLKTWTSRKTGICWLKHPEFLPRHVPKARVLSWGYNSSFSSLTGATPSSNLIHHHAQTLVAQLAADRALEGRSDVPILFLCHSLGGLVVKRALSYSKSREGNTTTHNVFSNTFGILFFGTPHRGSSRADMLLNMQKLVTATLPRSFVHNEQVLVNALQYDSETLQNITDYFDPIIKFFHIHFFWEEHKTNLGYRDEYIVTRESAAPEHDGTERSGIAATHSNMVKFETTASPGFRLVMATLSRYCEQAALGRRQRTGSDSSLPPYANSDYHVTRGGPSKEDDGQKDSKGRVGADRSSLYMPAIPLTTPPLVINGYEYTFRSARPRQDPKGKTCYDIVVVSPLHE